MTSLDLAAHLACEPFDKAWQSRSEATAPPAAREISQPGAVSRPLTYELVVPDYGRVETQSGWSEPACIELCGPLEQASPKDQTKSRRIQAFDGRGLGSPTGLVVSKLMPSKPSFLTEDTA